MYFYGGFKTLYAHKYKAGIAFECISTVWIRLDFGKTCMTASVH